MLETYPVLTLISKGWLLPDATRTERLPKYNPMRRKTYSQDDWSFVCRRVAELLSQHGLKDLSEWCDGAAELSRVTKEAQDLLDACLCLIPALELTGREPCLMVGDVDTGYMLIPAGDALESELAARCEVTGRDAADWLHTVTW